MQLNTLLYKNFAWRGFFYLTSLLLNIAIARMLGAVLSGDLYFFLNNIFFVLLIGSLSLDSGITYFTSKGEVSGSRLASFSIIWSVIIALLISVFFLYFYHNDPSVFQNRFLFFSCLCFTLGTVLTIFSTAFFYSHDQYKIPNLVPAVINLVLLICIPWKNNWLGFLDGKTFLTIFFTATLTQGMILAFSIFRSHGYRFTFRIFPVQDLAPVFRYSLAALTGNIIYFILYRIDYWFVEYYCSPQSLGNYIQVSRLGQLLIVPCTIIAATLFPQSSRQQVSFQSRSFARLLILVMAAYLLVSIFIFLTGRWIIHYLWGSGYDEMFEPLAITLPGIFFLAVSYMFSPLFAGHGKVNYNVFICLVSLVVVVILNFLLVPDRGINGAAMATTAGFTVMVLLYLILAKMKFGFSIRNLFSYNQK